MTTQKMLAIPGKAMAAPSLTALDDLTLDEIKDVMKDLATQSSINQYHLGAMYNHIVNRKLAELAGYKDAATYLNQHVKALSKSTLITYGMVARSFIPDICAQYGMYHLRALLRYLDATSMTAPADPGPMLIDVPQDDDSVVKKPFAECSVDDVERAARAKRATPTVRVPVADQARLLFLADSIHNQFEGVAEVRFTSRNKEGKTLVSLQDVPMTELARLTHAIQEGMDAEPTLAMSQKPATA
jgi:hypothetical protein